jgi:hypothetical protein
MTIQEFVENFKAQNVKNTQVAPNAIHEYITKELEVKDYIPFIEKQSIAQIVLESCAHMKDGVITIDSIQKYIIFTVTVLSTYTNLEFEGDANDLDSYDALCSYQVGDETLLNAIIKTFEKEYSRCNDILNMMTADLLAENNIEKQVGKFLSGISKALDTYGDSLIGKLGDFNMDLNQLDINKLSDIISKIK